MRLRYDPSLVSKYRESVGLTLTKPLLAEEMQLNVLSIGSWIVVPLESVTLMRYFHCPANEGVNLMRQLGLPTGYIQSFFWSPDEIA
jgi:hypothetical protein